MADKNHVDARRTFQHYGFIATSDPTSKHVEEPARADFKLIRAGRGVCVEVKDGKDENGRSYFDLSEWRENQRDWALRFCELPPYSTPYWVYLRIGLTQKNKIEPYITWLLPRKVMMGVCDIVQAIQNRLPYQVMPGISIEMQRRSLDALTLLAGYELQWYDRFTVSKPAWMLERFPDDSPTYSNGIYLIPENHPFYVRHIQVRRSIRSLGHRCFPDRWANP